MDKTKKGEIVVIGGGISGISAAVEIAEFGHKVTILEKEPSIGGRVSKLNKYFPKMCPPYCGLEIYYKRIRTNPNINVMTQAEVEKITGSAGNYTISVKTAPRFVNGKCTACGECIEACPVERENDFNYGMDKNKAVYLPHEMAFPVRYVIDAEACKGKECSKCISACKYDAIDLDMQPETKEIKADAVIYATGWKPYDANKIENLNFDKSENIITNVMMERLAAPNGPTNGKIVRPSDGKELESVAFVQCAGSRDENHMPFCSSVCCMGSIKQFQYIRDAYPNAQVYVFYIDLRTKGRYEDFLQARQNDEKLSLIKGKVADIEVDEKSGNLTVTAEDIYSNTKYHQTVDMVVLATGMNPSIAGENKPADLVTDKYGFLIDDNPAPNDGIFTAGSAKTPCDVSSSIRDANGAALKAMQCIERK